MDLNRVHFIGRLTKDPELVPAGRKGKGHAVFTLAINRVVLNGNGPQADYIPCVLWGDEVEKFLASRAKGDEVGIVGRVRTSCIPQASGPPRHFWEIRVDSVEYGRKSLKNLQPKPKETTATRAVGKLTEEFRRE